jgi:hypothetical protein
MASNRGRLHSLPYRRPCPHSHFPHLPNSPLTE